MRTLVLRLLVFALACEQAAQGQGTQNTLPDPISYRELEPAMQFLGVDAEQRHAIESAHEAYVDDVLRLRDGPVQKHLEFLWQMHEKNWLQNLKAEREKLRRFTNNQQADLAELGALEDTFFARMRAALREEQVPRWRHLMLWRSRLRHWQSAALLHRLVPPSGIDLVELCMPLELEPDVRERVDAVLRDYDEALTAQASMAGELVRTMHPAIGEALEARGFDEYRLEDEAYMQQMMEAWKEVGVQMGARVVSMGLAIGDLNRRTCERVADALPAGRCAELMRSYDETAYPDLHDWPVLGAAGALARQPELSAQQRADVEALLREFVREARGLRNRMMDIMDRRYAARSGFMYGNWQAGGDIAKDELATLHNQCKGLEERVHAALAEIVGDDWRERAVARPLSRANLLPEQPPAPPTLMDAHQERWSETSTFVRWVLGESWEKERITRDALLTMLKIAEVDAAHAEPAESLFDAYLQQFNATVGEAYRKLEAQLEALWERDPVTERPSPDPAAMDAYHAGVRSAGEEVRALDAAFFDELIATVAADDAEGAHALEMMRRIRLRATYSLPFDRWHRLKNRHFSREGDLDLVALCMREGCTPGRFQALAPHVDKYETEALRLRQERHDHGLRAHHVGDALTALRCQAADRNEQLDHVIADQHYARREEHEARMAAITREIMQLNRNTLEALLAALPEAEARPLEMTYEHAAFPRMTQAMPAFGELADAALGQDSLTTAQLEELSIMCAHAMGQANRLRRAMIETLRAGDNAVTPFEARDWSAAERTNQQINRLAFEAEDVFGRMRRRVRDVLSEAQWSAVRHVAGSHAAAGGP